MQAEAAKQFLAVMRQYMESFCSDLRLHTITSVQSNEKVLFHYSHICSQVCSVRFNKLLFPFQVSILLKDSYIDSFPEKEQPFIKVLSLLIYPSIFPNSYRCFVYNISPCNFLECLSVLMQYQRAVIFACGVSTILFVMAC